MIALFHRRRWIIVSRCVLCSCVIFWRGIFVICSFGVATGFKWTVERDMAQLVTDATFDVRTIFPGVTDFIAIAANEELIVVDDTAPLAAYLQRIWIEGEVNTMRNNRFPFSNPASS